ncbi:PEGA domain-containing protein [candidate division WWE3 bacterium]|nr:PEGA domain-containing protein [candidate division WWE3 bacterium]
MYETTNTPLFKTKPSVNILGIVTYVLAIFGVLSLVYFGGSVIKNYSNLKSKAALTISTVGGSAQVYLNDNFLGNTPLESKDIRAGENKLSIKNDQITYNVALDFLQNSEVAINRDLGVSDVFSSGQNIWLEKSSDTPSLEVISEPTGARVLVDNTEVGVTPYSTSTLTEGEYDLMLEKAGYESTSNRIKIQKGYKLNIAMKMFPNPVPVKINLLEGSESLYDIKSLDAVVASNPAEWVKAVIYWNKTRGINLAGAGINKEVVFDYFIDFNGHIYNKDGVDVTTSGELGAKNKGAYLGRAADGNGLTENAKVALAKVNVSGGGKKATINQTGTGWLNVRSTPGLSGEVLAKVNVGEVYNVLEESTGWLKIKVSDTLNGWVSATYVTTQ